MHKLEQSQESDEDLFIGTIEVKTINAVEKPLTVDDRWTEEIY